ncbi:hypothetical protein TELCIR_10915, partial [Teladorsagia circumcincta]
AYKRYLKKHGEEKPIEGFEQYNNEQIFFMGYAMSWCGLMTPDKLIFHILTNTHSPNRFRVNQVLANRPEFAADFKCAADPCVDFFEFSCGNWIAEHPIPDHKTSYSQFEVLTDKVQEQMRGNTDKHNHSKF